MLRYFSLRFSGGNHSFDFRKQLLYMRVIPFTHSNTPDVVLLFSYIRGYFVYCPFLLVRFTLEAYGEKDYVVPENYEHIRDNIYAVVKDGLIVEYKKIVLQSGQYVWLDCEAKEIMK